MRRREQNVLASFFGLSRSELTALNLREYNAYREVYTELNKQKD